MKFKIAFLLSLVGYLAVAQEDDKAKQKALTASKDLTWEGNKQLSEDNFTEAEVDYRKAIAKSDENVAARYNLGNAYYNNETYSEAFGRFKQAGELASDKSDKHVAYHNMGNVFMKRKDYQKAVEAYKEALRSDPTDDETRYNLALAKEMLKKEQQQNEQNKDNKDEKDKKDQSEDKKEGDNEDKNKDQDKKDQGDKGDKGDQNEEKKDENKQGEGDQKKEQNKKPEQGDQQEQEQPQQRRPNQLSKQQVQNLLEAMQNEEKKVQEKMDAQKVKGAKVSTEKDW